MSKEKYVAIVLAAGKGTRMGCDVHKQYLLLNGKPVLYYSLMAFEKSDIDEIILVTGKEEEEYCKKEIIEKYQFKKVKKIVAGGEQRYHSVFCGIKAIEQADYILIHDGARPFLNQRIIERCMENVKEHQACVVGMPVKDTIKVADKMNFAQSTPDREFIWSIQTPQCFSYSLILHSYKELMKKEEKGIKQKITDDAMVVEAFSKQPIKLIEGSYKNIKITTPEDLQIAEVFCMQEL